MKQTVNLDRIAELKEMDEPGSEEIQRQLVEMYLASAPERISELKACADPVELKKIAHSLKSTSLNMGCDKLADLCQMLEKGEGDLKYLIEECDKELGSIKQEFAKLYP